MTEPIQAFPLQWPPGWRRITNRTDAAFRKGKPGFTDTGWRSAARVEIGEGVRRVMDELGRMGARNTVISSDLQLRNDGLPRAGQAQPRDPGVAVYWSDARNPKARRCMAIDRYTRIADNLAAIAATLDAMRAIERHGGAAILDRAFTGFTALPAPEQPWQVLGLGANPTRGQVEDAHRRLAMQHHPDRGGDTQQMARINAARDALLEGLR